MNEREIFIAALKKEDPVQRQAYLDETCAQQPELRKQVEKLLEIHEGAGSFLGQPAVESMSLVTLDQPVLERPGVQIGPYKLLEQIGEGGMGTVFMAEQSKPVQRRVAIKVIKPGMDSGQVIARFEAERQALSLMDHPHIAKVLDAGTTEAGRPYFVMELVKGVPITNFCDESRLPPKARLELFTQVCQAVQHAHSKGVIHRDLKPTNVMVTLYDEKPVPKVIDFGVAKATGSGLTERTLFTGYGQIVGTLDYMSPEQARFSAVDVDTRSDVYSLGVLLYELLTGTTPFDQKRLRAAAFDEVLRIIAEEEPPRPSTRLSTTDGRAAIASNRGMDPKKLSGLVRGELDWIVMKLLEKDRNRRYETAKDIADDVRRYLNDEPVQACPPSTWYRLSKFNRRYRTQLVTAGVVLSLLVFLIGIVGWGLWDRSIREQKVARERDAQDAATKLKIAEVTAAEAEKRERELRREVLLQNARELQVTKHGNGWRAKVHALLRQAGAVRRDLRVRSQAIASLHGLDARLENPRPSFTGSSIVFERPLGRRLLVGGLSAESRGPQGQPARVWDGESSRVVSVSNLMRSGPVAFRGDGTPVQFAVNPKNERQLLLWDVARNQAIREFDFPSAESETLPELSSLAVSEDASHVAVSGRVHGKGLVGVWRTDTGELVQKLPIAAATALRFSPDSTLLSAADEGGSITVYSLHEGEAVASLKSDRTDITCLAMQKDRRTSGQPTARWLIAAGDASGAAFVWDGQNSTLRFRCYSSANQVHAVAFSPDGMTLAAGGRGKVKLWDIATGQHLLDLDAGNWITDVSFSADGTWIAASMQAAFDDPGEVRVWKLETGRVHTLCGLSSQIEKVWFSPDEQLVAALSHDSRVAVWSIKTGQLLHVFEPPVALWADNCGGAFSLDSKQFAFSGSHSNLGSAQLWSLESGQEIGAWSLPPGLNHILAFHPSGRLLHFQVEERAGRSLPDSSMNVQEHPRVVRIRDLLANPSKPILEITEFNRHIDFPIAALDGRIFALVGYYGDKQLAGRQIVVVDTLTGEKIWTSEPETDVGHIQIEKVGLKLDRDGWTLGIIRGVSGSGKEFKSTLIELPSGRVLSAPPDFVSYFTFWNREMPYWVSAGHPLHVGQLALIRSGDVDPVAILGRDREPTGTERPYNASGTRAAWGNSDGIVHVIDFPQVLEELKKLNLEW